MSADESTHLPMSDSHVVVTGSSSGIGKATAIEMAKQGARKVLIHYRSNIRGAEGTAKEIEGTRGQRYMYNIALCWHTGKQQETARPACWTA